ncbi:PqqD family protein [Eubacterium sp.]|uniref:PqqD family protein n=1 Tax=Eubacterium sp. TaxID=142586 RepID=UPI003F0D7D22
MKIKDGFVTRKIGDRIIAIPVGSNSQDFNGMITLNETGLFIWNCLTNDTTVDEIAERIIAQYSTTKDEAIIAVNNFVDELKASNLLEE